MSCQSGAAATRLSGVKISTGDRIDGISKEEN